MSAGHTPTPWVLSGETAVYALDESGRTNRFYAHVQGGYVQFFPDRERVRTDDAEVAANAAFIVRAVNAHDDLVAALKEARERCGTELHPMVDAALAKAELP